ncbi:MAG: DUF2490 domain-containing protein [Cyclobacteriaceae bacterium]
MACFDSGLLIGKQNGVWLKDHNSRLGDNDQLTRVALLFLFLLSYQSLRAQNSTTQIWGEYLLTQPLRRSYKVEGRVAYRHDLDRQVWSQWEFRVMPEKKLNKHFDVLATLQYLATEQAASFTTREIREGLGTRIHFTPGSRIDTRLLLRVEQRNVYKVNAENWDHTSRGRIRAEAQGPINQKTMSGNHVWYALADVEAFLFVDANMDERFANRLRARAGMGYKLSHQWQFEIIYMWQESKNTLADDYENQQSIIRLRVRQTLNNKNLKQ